MIEFTLFSQRGYENVTRLKQVWSFRFVVCHENIISIEALCNVDYYDDSLIWNKIENE